MKQVLLPVAGLIAAFALSGCASLSENECRTADWESIGYLDGTRGYNSGRIGDHVEACAKVGISPDRKLYEEGRNRGLEEFCTGRNGVRVGEQGSTYSGVCPVDLEPGFLRGYNIGRDLYDLKSHMDRLQSEVQQTQARLRQKDPPLTDYQRDQLIYRLRDLEREYGRAESDYQRAQRRARDF
jgi:Protein of unknown function (DUF2799)